ncbi:M1 family aminopeptidase [Jatrophihabitans sp.]|uniref:M1 family aminopeptidase n=1 Tax=Jatrophihabitans sp. TaxID=1932789 RepID=UPI002CDA201B|nr:M1 family aminopeptidase [Jatrophihabitans sp.]
MTSRGMWIGVAASVALVAGGTAAAGPAEAGAGRPHCSSGAHTLSHYGDQLYPETGNGGYRSLHTDVHLVYDAPSNRFLAGTHVDLTDRATQCLTDFSLDFERSSSDRVAGPDLAVSSVSVNGRPAKFRFVQPTYPGDPRGQDDPDPRAHQAGQQNPVGGPRHNPLPPACEPQLTGDSPNAQDGQPCPANKLVIIPTHPIRAGATFVVTVRYTGRPGTHIDGDGSTEGWFRSETPPGDGGFVTTEPVGTEAWMPLNDHPSAKPTYDFYDTVNAGKTAIANGILLSQRHNRPDARFPAGSTTWHWRMAAPTASYLVENSIGSYDLTERTAANGIRFYQAQSSSLSPAQQAANRAIMAEQPDITAFQSHFNGPFPFSSNGILIGTPDAGFEEEMQTMIAFASGSIDLETLHHENMHQWWGDNVTESNYDMTFFKEGMATLGEYLYEARTAGATGGPAAFQASLVEQFNTTYARTGSFWRVAPSKPTAYTLFSGSSTYTRPGIAYIAVRQILGPARFNLALQQIQRRYGGGTIDERQLEAAFARQLPNHSKACREKLGQFFRQWFDTGYPTAGGAAKPQITGPGLAGAGFYDRDGDCDGD